MHYRLPLELELTVLELAAPPLAIDSLHARVRFFIDVSLVHRSLTAWAQDRLRDQFLYTYRPRPDEHGRLKTRLEAGFGRDQPLRRHYLDLSRLPRTIDSRKASGTDSVSATINGRVYEPVSSISRPGGPEQVASRAQEQACDAVAHYSYPARDTDYDCWELCPMITSYSQALDMLWLKLPCMELNIKNWPPPRVLYIDDGAFNEAWGWFRSLPLASETALFLRNIDLCPVEGVGGYGTRHMVFHGCRATGASLLYVLRKFPQLETLFFFKPRVPDLVSMLVALPTPIRRVHILEHKFEIDEDRPNARLVLPHLESFTYTLLFSEQRESLQTSADDGNDAPGADHLVEVHQVVESSIDAPLCAFNFLRSTKSPEEALADALATCNL